jgi:hypothetical protein
MRPRGAPAVAPDLRPPPPPATPPSAAIAPVAAAGSRRKLRARRRGCACENAEGALGGRRRASLRGRGRRLSRAEIVGAGVQQPGKCGDARGGVEKLVLSFPPQLRAGRQAALRVRAWCGDANLCANQEARNQVYRDCPNRIAELHAISKALSALYRQTCPRCRPALQLLLTRHDSIVNPLESGPPAGRHITGGTPVQQARRQMEPVQEGRDESGRQPWGLLESTQYDMI